MFAVTSLWLCWTLLSVSLVRFTCAGSFVVNVTQTSYQAEENHNITLEWTFTVETGRPPTYLIIYCDLITGNKSSLLYHVHNGAEVSESQDEKFSGRVQGEKDALREGRIRLQLCRLRTEDSGRYKCQVNTDYGSSSASCRLNVTAAAEQRSTSPPQEERKDWKNILIFLTAAAALLTLLMWNLFSVVLRKKRERPNFYAPLNSQGQTL
ncbi:programmed cell death 1 ligand 1-like isoform X1 [Simochromis diagramma]|uniref:programmed cell death 1 ligand 1-like isoform X1 n=1 Tax=Simochromis diagramma TaxID=43689 RepID=UPI001A7E5A15|nr:programmed cell death 1 ligand 1-like isoform X1 [Simochromis diagramma]